MSSTAARARPMSRRMRSTPLNVYGRSKLAGERAVADGQSAPCDPAHGLGLQPVIARISSRRSCALPPNATASPSSPISAAARPRRATSPRLASTSPCAAHRSPSGAPMASITLPARARRPGLNLPRRLSSWRRRALPACRRSCRLPPPTIRRRRCGPPTPASTAPPSAAISASSRGRGARRLAKP